MTDLRHHTVRFRFSAKTFPRDHFTVQTVRGRETFNRPYCFSVTVSAPSSADGDGYVELLVGQRAALTIRVADTTRVVPGVLERVTTAPDHERAHHATVTFKLVPLFTLLRHQRGSRIFQDMRVDQVVESVLRAAGVETRWDLSRNYPVRPYVTQYEETDLAFVERLLAEAGIFYSFARTDQVVAELADGEPPLPEEIMVFGDDVACYAPLDLPGAAAASPALYYAPGEGLASATADRIARFAAVRRVRSEYVEYREFDPARPAAPLVSRAAPQSVQAPHRLETYEHHGVFHFPDWRDAGAAAQRIRRETTRRRSSAEGISPCPTLTPGARFELADHPTSAVDGEYVVVSAVHRGSTEAGEPAYSNHFEVVPADVPFLPRRTSRGAILTMLTATVTGPPSEEIHVDGGGRIQVRFHWDRGHASSDGSSCWIRVVQPWAGTGFGHQFIPRVGMEVAVTFDGGDPDKPIVTGSLYNGTHIPPFSLPRNKTQSGIRTRSSPGSGHNELMFEDLGGKERIYIHAERDLDEVVRHDHTLSVGANEHLDVRGRRQQTVGGDALTNVHGRVFETAEGDVSIEHRASRLDVVSMSLDQRVRVDRTTRVEGRELLEIRGEAQHGFLSDVTTRVIGNATWIVGRHEAPRALTLRAEGTAHVSSEDVLELASAKSIVLRCGKTTLRIGEDGIELCGLAIRAAGEAGALSLTKDGVKLATDTTLAHLSKGLLLKTDGASLSMAKEVKVDGSKILLNAPDRATDDPPPEPEEITEIILVDRANAPLARQRFVVELADGSQRTGVTDKDGTARLDLPSDGTIRFLDLPDIQAE